MKRILAAWPLCAIALPLQAQTFGGSTYTVMPQPASEITPVSVRLDSLECAELPTVARVNIVGNVIDLGIEQLDYCEFPPRPMTRIYPIGVLPAGNYTLNYQDCYLSLFTGQIECTTFGSTTFGVAAGLGQRNTIPATTWPALLLTGLVAAICAWRRLQVA